MHRIDSSGSIQGRFSNGNPAAGQRATLLTADWFNDVQETLAFVIEEAGIALVKGDDSQLSAAIQTLIAGVVGDGSGAVPTTRVVSAGGLVQGGGSLAVDRSFTVLKAAASDVVTGTRDDMAITPLALAGAASAGLSTNGYWRAPGGLIIQWGQLRGNYTEGSVSVVYPIAFPTAVYVTLPVALNQSGNINLDLFAQNVSRSLTSATFFFNFDGDGSNSIQGLDYLAIGR